MEHKEPCTNSAHTDISLHVSKIILKLILNLEIMCIWFNASVGLLCFVLTFGYAFIMVPVGFYGSPSHLSPCLLHFHSVYKMAKAFIHML